VHGVASRPAATGGRGEFGGGRCEETALCSAPGIADRHRKRKQRAPSSPFTVRAVAAGRARGTRPWEQPLKPLGIQGNRESTIEEWRAASLPLPSQLATSQSLQCMPVGRAMLIMGPHGLNFHRAACVLIFDCLRRALETCPPALCSSKG
jgi:hypothetical protein